MKIFKPKMWVIHNKIEIEIDIFNTSAQSETFLNLGNMGLFVGMSGSVCKTNRVSEARHTSGDKSAQVSQSAEREFCFVHVC